MKGSQLAGLSWEELATRRLKISPRGVEYLLKGKWGEKSKARNQVLSWFSRREFPQGLSILTMPSLRWSFERALLKMREGANYQEADRPRRTFICALEREEDLYRLGMLGMPGSQHLLSFTQADFATTTCYTPAVVRFHRCEFEALAGIPGPPFDAAWLDFTGNLPARRLQAIQYLWEHRIRKRLVVTYFKGRDLEGRTSKEVRAALLECLPGGRAQDLLEYRDTSPMCQLVVDRLPN